MCIRDSFKDAHTILNPTGRLCLILPYEQTTETIQCATNTGYYLWSRTDVRPNPDAELKRVLLEFGKQSLEIACKNTRMPIHNELIIESTRNQFSADYQALTQHFHLRFADDT